MPPAKPSTNSSVKFSPTQQPLRIVLVDSDSMVRRTLAFAIQSVSDDALVSTFAHFDALKKSVLVNPDVAIVNLRMAKANLGENLHYLREHHPALFIIGISILRHDDAMIDSAISQKIDALITQETSLQDMLGMIQHGAVQARLSG